MDNVCRVHHIVAQSAMGCRGKNTFNDNKVLPGQVGNVSACTVINAEPMSCTDYDAVLQMELSTACFCRRCKSQERARAGSSLQSWNSRRARRCSTD